MKKRKKITPGNVFIVCWEVLVLALMFLLLAMDGSWELHWVFNLLLSAMPFYIIPFAIVLPRRVMKNHQRYLTSKGHWICVLVLPILAAVWMLCVRSFGWPLLTQGGSGALLATSASGASKPAALIYLFAILAVEMSGVIGLMQSRKKVNAEEGKA